MLYFLKSLGYKKIAARIGAPDSRVHDLRHTFAVISLQNKDDVKTVQENLGHATASFTLDVYGHVSERMRQESADRMQEYIQSVIGKKKEAIPSGKKPVRNGFSDPVRVNLRVNACFKT